MKTKIYVPLDTTAISLGADDVVSEILKLAEKNNHNVEIIRNGSWGLFWLEPLVEVVVEGNRVAYGAVKKEDVAGLFNANFLKGGDHKLKIGDITKLPYLKKQTRLCFKRVGVIDPVNIQDYIAHDGFKGLRKALKMTQEEIIKEVEYSGLRGRGGAAFPSFIKLDSARKAIADEKFVVCNFDEGDSGTFSDRMIGEGDPFMLIEGMLLTALSMGAEEGYIYLRSEYPIAKKVLTNAINTARKEGWLGHHIQGTKFNFDIHLRVGAGSYVCGEETALLNSLEGKRGTVRVKPPLPVHKGLFGKPTAICVDVLLS
jgi:formate dehydrogenase iron-sulfur subunit